MTTPQVPTPRRCISWYHRFMDWLWFGPLTRDLRPYRVWRPAPLEERRDER